MGILEAKSKCVPLCACHRIRAAAPHHFTEQLFPFMIAYLKGIFVDLSPTNLIVECSGVGYSVNISLTTYTALSGKSEGKIFVTQIIREDAHLLYGFYSLEEQELFRLLTSVSGVGPNTARVILSSYQPRELSAIISLGQIEPLKAVKGIGLKTAQRILVDLKGKIVLPEDGEVLMNAPNLAIHTAGRNELEEEAIAALKMLGYPEQAAAKVIKQLLKTDPEVEVGELIKQSLKML